MDTDPRDWEELATDGDIYYHNVRSHKTVWSKPDCLLTEAERTEMAAEWIWVKHRHDAWVPAKVESRGSDGSLSCVERETSKRRTVKAESVGPAIPNIRDLITMTSDLVQMAHVNESSIIDLLKRRFKRDKCYTAIGDILIAVNPFKRLPHFTPAEIAMYRGRGTKDMQPHPYLIIDSAYNDVCALQRNQSVLISGESGAGKTFTVKVLLGYLAEVAGSPTQVEKKILAANPVLEAFGNAKTLRNDNSSRFGKFIEIMFERNRHQIIGCHTINYLLEKSRIANQGPGERNFHIFYYMCDPECFSAEERAALELGNVEDYTYTSGGGCWKARTHDDHDEHADMEEGFKNLGFTPDQRKQCMELTAAVLHLGQIKFEDEGSSGSKPTGASNATIATVARLLGVSPGPLGKGMTELVTDQFTRAFSPAKAAETRDSLCKAIYSHVFDWLVAQCNIAMKKADESVETDFIGMLDIFGFEIFKKNGFEQLCINFANEKLQQMFNKHTFLLEEETYAREGVPFEHVSFYDSQPMLTFLGLPAKGKPKGGLFGILDEQTAVQSTDEKFLNQLKSKFGKGGKKSAKGLFSDRVKARDGFRISHYAGDVLYSVTNFIQKNADKLEANLLTLLGTSSQPLLGKLFAPSTKAKKSKGGTKTQGGYFMGQLRKLEQTVDATWPRFIRCVKPNQQKIPDEFDAPLSLEQLRFAGVFEAVEIRKQGYPYRKIHEHFFKDYRLLLPKAKRPEIHQTDYAAVCKKMLPMLTKEIPEAARLNMGTTMVLYKSTEHRILELKRLQVLNYYCSACQCSYKGKFARRLYKRLKPLRPILEAAIRSRSIPTLDAALAKVASESFKMYCHTMAEVVRGVLQAEEDLKEDVKALLKNDAEEHYKEYCAMVEQMERWITKDPLAFQDAASKECRKKHRQVMVRRSAIAALIAAVAGVEGSEVASALSVVDAAIDQCTAAVAEVGFAFCATEQSACASKQAELRKEKAACEALTAAMGTGQPKGTKRMLDVSGMNAAPLKKAVTAVESLPPQCIDTIKHLPIGVALRDLRAATIIAAKNPEAKAESPEWQSVEQCLTACSSAGLGDTDEVKLVRGALAMRAAVEKVVEKVNAAVALRDDGLMSTSLGQADELELDTHPDKSIASAVLSAKAILADVLDAKGVLQNGTAQVSESLLASGLERAAACQYSDAGMAGESLCATATELLGWIINITDEAIDAVDMQYLGLMEAALSAADEIHLSTPEIEEIRTIVAVSFRERKVQEKERAMAHSDYARAVRIELEIQADVFGDARTRSDFELRNYAMLKTPEAFTKRSKLKINFATFNANAENMLHWVRHSLHTSLSVIDGPPGATEQDVLALHKMARNLFKDVMGVMKDRRTDYPEAAAHELLDEGRGLGQMGDEVFMQIMKQITPDLHKDPSPGPSEEASDRGWLMLAMCCATFPPSDAFKPYLESFLRSQGKDVHLHLLHQTLLAGKLRDTPEPEVLYTLLRGGSLDSLATAPRDSEIVFGEWEDVVAEPQPNEWRCAGRRRPGAAAVRTPRAVAPPKKSATKSSSGSPTSKTPPTPPKSAAKKSAAAKPKGVKATVLYDWAGEHAGDLSITEDEIVHIEHVPDEEDWYMATNKSGKKGLVPHNYVDLHGASAPDVAASSGAAATKVAAPAAAAAASPSSSRRMSRRGSRMATATPHAKLSSTPAASAGAAEEGEQRAIVLYDLKVGTPGVLTLNEGDTVWIKKTNDEAWLHGRTEAGKVGALPSNFVEVVHEDEGDTLTPLPASKSGGSGAAKKMRRRSSVQGHRPRGRMAAGAAKRCKALYDYEAADASDLGFSADEILTYSTTDNSDWLKATNSEGETGTIPANYVDTSFE